MVSLRQEGLAKVENLTNMVDVDCFGNEDGLKPVG